MNAFVRRENIRRWRGLLATAADDMLRNQLCRLIAEEEREQLLQQIAEKPLEQPWPAIHAVEPA